MIFCHLPFASSGRSHTGRTITSDSTAAPPRKDAVRKLHQRLLSGFPFACSVLYRRSASAASGFDPSIYAAASALKPPPDSAASGFDLPENSAAPVPNLLPDSDGFAPNLLPDSGPTVPEYFALTPDFGYSCSAEKIPAPYSAPPKPVYLTWADSVHSDSA